MPRNGTGTYVLPLNWENDDAADIPIQADRMMDQEQDIADALTQSISTDGQTVPVANLTMGGFRLLATGDATANTDALNVQSARGGTGQEQVASGTDTYTLAPSPGLTAYARGVMLRVIFTNANTGPATINVNGLGARAITKNGSAALAGGDIPAGVAAILIDDGTRFQLFTSQTTPGPYGLQNVGIVAQTSTAHVGQFTTYDCSASAQTCILQSATVGQVIGINKYGTNILTISFAGQFVNGSTADLTTSGEGPAIFIMNAPATRGFSLGG